MVGPPQDMPQLQSWTVPWRLGQGLRSKRSGEKGSGEGQEFTARPVPSKRLWCAGAAEKQVNSFSL